MYFNPRFEALTTSLGAMQVRLDAMQVRLDATQGVPLTSPEPPADESGAYEVAREHAALLQHELLQRIDVSPHNRRGRPPSFDQLESQAASAAQCEHPAYLAWLRVLRGGTNSGLQYHRKMWEWAFIAEAATQAGVLTEGNYALGFGCGTEPLPALFASRGLRVVATDMPADAGDPEWDLTAQLMRGLESLSAPSIISDEELARRVSVRPVDMTRLPDDLGRPNLTWSSCVIEHLGSPTLAMDFVMSSARLLAPGGLAVHTTEYELTRRTETVDYGHCAVFRLQDFEELLDRATAEGFRMSLNPYVAMDAPQDRWVSLALTSHAQALQDAAHLKLVINESVSTSFGLVVHRPADD
jgi:SAM-dependent methyltransferase